MNKYERPPIETLDGDFKLLRRVAFGGDSEVYLAEQRSVHNRKTIIKLFRERWDRRKPHTPFKREHRLLSLVTEPVFPAVYRAGISPLERPYLAMEHIPGKSLGKHFERGDEALPIEVVRAVFDAVCLGLEEIHAHDFVHRDLKPDNIMLARGRDGHYRVRLIDFSHARHPNEPASYAVDDEGPLTGTQNYMAPEQVLGEAVDGRTDVFSLAAVVYEMLTSVRAIQPLQVSQKLDFLTYMRQGHPVPTYPLGTFRPDLPLGLEGALKTALALKPEARFKSVAAFQGAVHGALEGFHELRSRDEERGLFRRIKEKLRP